jgi:glycosyltransferase involved in cell wall biosynthesis
MKILFIHPNIPGQYKHLVQRYAADPANTVVFICKPKAEVNIKGVHKVEYQPRREASPATHRYLIGTERAVLQGQEVWRVCKKLKEEEGFTPDIICTHPGWGDGLYLKDIYPDTPLLSYFEFYYHYTGADVNFDPELPVKIDDAARIRTKNITNLLNLEAADWGITPTHWQKSVHPAVFQPKISVLHEGVDTQRVAPNPQAVLEVKNRNLTFKAGDPVITYVTRNFEHYRGYHQFLRAAKIILEARKDVHIVALGADDVSYGRRPADGRTYRQSMMDEVKPDASRIHYLGQVDYDAFLRVLQISAAHIYLTVPFVLSWSMLEAMSAGCLVLGSNTTPVLEVLEDGHNGVVVDYFSPEDIAQKALAALARPQDYVPIRQAARQTIIHRFDLQKLLPLHEKLIAQVAAKQHPPAVQAEIDALYDGGLQARMALAS